MSNDNIAFEIKNFEKIFKNNKGIKDISLKIHKGKITSILGHNGAGKTTLIKLITQELKPDKGEVLVQGQKPDKDFYQKIGFLPDQNSFPMDYKLKEFLVYNAILRGVQRDEANIKADDFLMKLGLEKYQNKTFRQLSAGMKKVALLAATMINDPEIIIMDEPTANLDIENRSDLLGLIDELAKAGKTIVITSHILEELEGVTQNLIVIKDGVKEYDKPFDKGKEKLTEIYNQINNPDSKRENKFKNVFN
ncbi:ABC transporter ATP-binding protein [Spiroplasma endosymbiont of Panorpa germanica]|uniref:ABC transporter ATP-binding protein n=1 Tax=Spiroplasma endosymbiont of Panorpa germanica TaxID=3066314 RepID=UPI0030CC21EB